MLIVVALILADEQEDSNKSTFDTCLDELKSAVSSSSDDELGNEYEPEWSLEESIRIYDECLSREGVTLSIHGTLGESGETNSATGNVPENPSAEGTPNESESSSQVRTNGENSPSSNSSDQANDLESSLHDFDTMLSQIQDEVDAERAEQLAQNERRASEIAQSAQNTHAEQQDTTEDLSGEQSEGSLSNPSATVSAEAKHEDSKTRTPLDPKDEDIVLKTIREAAELETNPTTRQALWDQYYEYADKKN